jgi:hypothetical protein
MGFSEPVIGPATSGRTRWLYLSFAPTHSQSAVAGDEIVDLIAI